MKKSILIFACLAISFIGLSNSTFPMHRTFNHPCLPLEFYKYAFGWIVKEAQESKQQKNALLVFIEGRKMLLRELQRSDTHRYAHVGEQAFQYSQRLVKSGKLTHDDSHAIWQYGCLAQNMIRYAIRKNLGVKIAEDLSWQNRLHNHETWPMKIVPLEEADAFFERTYGKTAILMPAIVIEERTAHTVMQHFLQNPNVIHEKHIAHLKN